MSNQNSDYHIVVIGMGYIGGFLLPGYEMLLGNKVASHVHAIKASPRNLEELNQLFPFETSVADAPEVLRRFEPEIIILSVPPKLTDSVVRDVLAPYYSEQRSNDKQLPDLYAFAPSPDPIYYYQVLGRDINCVRFLPSMAMEKNGVPLQKIGGSFLTFSEQYPFPKAQAERAIAFSNLFGRTYLLNYKQSLQALTSKNTAHLLFDISYAIIEAMENHGISLNAAQVGNVMRLAYQKHTGNTSNDSYLQSSLDGIPEQAVDFIERQAIAWYQGILNYLIFVGFEPDLAQEFHGANFEVWSATIQLSTQEELQTITSQHATKGGVNEMAIGSFNRYYRDQLKGAVSQYLKSELDPSFYDLTEGMAFAINMTTDRHAARLAAK